MLTYKVLQIVNNIGFMVINTYICLQKSNVKPFYTPKQHITIHFGFTMQDVSKPFVLFFLRFFVHNNSD